MLSVCFVSVFVAAVAWSLRRGQGLVVCPLSLRRWQGPVVAVFVVVVVVLFSALRKMPSAPYICRRRLLECYPLA